MLPVLAGVATAATFNLFQPATGILKGNASTYVTTAAVSSDVIATFTGTCNNGTYLRGDGSCNTPPGTGVSSVGLTMPTGFSVGGSPITSSGTLAVTTTLNGVVHGNGSGLSASNVLLGSEVSGTLPVGNGGSGATTLTGVLHGNGTSAFTAANVALGSEVSGTLPVSNGGTGAATLTGVLKGNGTSAFTAATSADVIGLWSGTCNSGSFLRGDGACAAAGAGSVTSVAAGTGITASPSPITTTGTLSVNQAFAPTWTGNHTFQGTTAVTFNGSSTDEQLRLARTNAFLSFYNTANTTRTGYIQGNAGSNLTIASETGSLIMSSSSGGTITLAAAAALPASSTVGGTAICLSSGTNCPSTPTLGGSNTWTGSNNFTVVQPQFNGNSLTSVVNFASSNVAAAGGCSNASNVTSCVKNSTGYYTITLTSGISNMKCNVTADSTSGVVRIPAVHTTAFTTVDVRIVDGSATLTDTAFDIICIF